MKRVTGIGGVFFRSEDPKKLRDWYAKHLEIPNMSPYGAVFELKNDSPTGHTVWNPFSKDSDYFAHKEQHFMLNFRVENLEQLLKTLKSEGVEIAGEIESYEYGKFGWIIDPEGNKVELWEPVEEEFNKINGL